MFQPDLFEQRRPPDILTVLAALKYLRIKQVHFESEIHDKIAEALENAKIPFEKEFRLGPRNRIDFLVGGGIGIEVKKSRPNENALLQQINRYLSFDAVESIIIVIQKQRHLNLPSEIGGKRIDLVSTNQLWGVAI